MKRRRNEREPESEEIGRGKNNRGRTIVSSMLLASDDGGAGCATSLSRRVVMSSRWSGAKRATARILTSSMSLASGSGGVGCATVPFVSRSVIMSSFSRVLIVVASVVVAVGLASTAHATVIADWTFDGTGSAWLNDSSGNGHTLQVNGDVSQGTGGTASFANGGWLTTVSNLDLSPYRQITISWSQNGPAITEPTAVTFQTNDSEVGGFSTAGTIGNNWPGPGARWDSITGPSGVNVATCPNGTMTAGV